MRFLEIPNIIFDVFRKIVQCFSKKISLLIVFSSDMLCTQETKSHRWPEIGTRSRIASTENTSHVCSDGIKTVDRRSL